MGGQRLRTRCLGSLSFDLNLPKKFLYYNIYYIIIFRPNFYLLLGRAIQAAQLLVLKLPENKRANFLG